MSSQFVEGFAGRCRDADGAEYIDLRMAFGANLLGYTCEAVSDRVREQLKKGILFSGPHQAQLTLCQRLADLFPCAKGDPHNVILRKTGSEAVAMAVRLARAFTARDQVLRCGYHGWLDWCADGVFPRFYGDHGASTTTFPLGIPKEEVALTTRFDVNDIAALEELLSSRVGKIACIVIAPEEVLPPLDRALKALRALADHHEALLVLDEVKTGFRASLGGVQRLTGVTADLVVVSKGLANGLPLAATIGRPDIMSLSSKTFLSSTYSGELLSIVAAHAVLDIFGEHDVVSHLRRLGELFIDGVNSAAKRLGLSEQVIAIGWPIPAMPFVQLKGEQLNPASFEENAEKMGLLLYGEHMNFICFAHKEQDMEKAVECCEQAIEQMLAD